MSNTKSNEYRRDKYKTFRISPLEKTPLTFICQTLGITPSAAVRKSIQYFAFDLASSLPVPETDSNLPEPPIEQSQSSSGLSQPDEWSEKESI